MTEKPKSQQCALVRQQGVPAGHLRSIDGGRWEFCYLEGYRGHPVSLTMPVRREPYQFASFPPVFDGLLPEGYRLQAIFEKHNIDPKDSFRLLMLVGGSCVGSLTVEDARASPSLDGLKGLHERGNTDFPVQQ